jgi:hypothetical protein
MKRWASVFIAVSAAFAVLSCSPFGAGSVNEPVLSEDGLFEYKSPSSSGVGNRFTRRYHTSSDNVVISAYLGNSTAVNIPPLLGGRPVGEIGDEVFKGRGLTAVTFPSSVTHIGARAFADNLLADVKITAGSVRIGGSAFENNPINRVTLPNDAAVSENAFPSNLAEYYYKNIRQSGTYTLKDGKVLYNGAAIPEYVTLITTSNTWLEKIGGKEYNIDAYIRVEGNKGGFYIPPGNHRLIVNYNNLSTIDTDSVTLEPQNFVAGRTYLLSALFNGNKVYFTVTEVLNPASQPLTP